MCAVIVTVASTKGGVGKTTLAYELAAAWGAVLVDFDWETGGATGMWGSRPHGQVLAALDGGRPPRPREAPGRPALVPGHPDLSEPGWQAERVADAIERWAASWRRPVVVDTHPGAGDLMYGAIAAAQVVAVPVVLRERELDALAGMLDEFAAYPLVLCPNLVPPVPPDRQVRRLRALAGDRPVAPYVSAFPWWGRRARRSALVCTPPARRTAAAVAQLRALADALAAQVQPASEEAPAHA